MGMHVILHGNPVDGFEIIGPFTTGEDAVDWASRHEHQFENSWWIAPLRAKEEIDA